MSDLSRRLAALGLGAAALGFAGCLCGAFTARGAWFEPADVQAARVQCPLDAPELPRGKRLRMLVWNVQFGAGRGQQFFYDGGRAVSVDVATVEATLDAIADVVRRVDPDVILWQELDVDSRRTGGIDQPRALQARLPGAYPCTTETPYHKAAYVPHPPHEHMGRVDMRLAIWSRYRIDDATRYDLPRLDESWVRQQFNLKRALLVARLPIAGGGTLHAFDTHLAAFSMGDGTLPRQLEVVAAQMDRVESMGDPWILGADLNSLPPGDDPSRLSDHAVLYDSESPLTGWFERYTPAVPLEEHATDPQPYRTWLPFQEHRADRAIDYVFHGPAVQMNATSVLQDVTQVSDHHPLIFDFALP